MIFYQKLFCKVVYIRLMPFFPLTPSPLQPDSCLQRCTETACQGHHGMQATTPSSHLASCLPELPRSRGGGRRAHLCDSISTLVSNLDSLGFPLTRWLRRLLSYFLFLLPNHKHRHNNGLCFQAQSWLPYYSLLHPLPSESQVLNTICVFCLICALQYSWLPVTQRYSMLLPTFL